MGYRVENGVLLLSGDPVGPDVASPTCWRRCGRSPISAGCGWVRSALPRALVPLKRVCLCTFFFLGDEAVLDLGRFSLEGRPIRKVRQSVSRLEKAGFSAQLHAVAELDAATTAAVEAVLERGREGAPERGFSMAMDSIRSEHDADTLVLLARDESDPDRPIRGVLHFVPCYGRAAMSLSFMRRDPGTPNGLTEFMVVRAVELLRERGVEEISLNFAAFAKWLHSPQRASERALAKLIALGNPFFQIESLYRFNAKFFPRWEPRYLVSGRWAACRMPRLSAPAANRAAPAANSLTFWRRSTTLSGGGRAAFSGARLSGSACSVAPLPYAAPTQ